MPSPISEAITLTVVGSGLIIARVWYLCAASEFSLEDFLMIMVSVRNCSQLTTHNIIPILIKSLDHLHLSNGTHMLRRNPIAWACQQRHHHGRKNHDWSGHPGIQGPSFWVHGTVRRPTDPHMLLLFPQAGHMHVFAPSLPRNETIQAVGYHWVRPNHPYFCWSLAGAGLGLPAPGYELADQSRSRM